MGFYKTTEQKEQRAALLRRAYVHLAVNLAASKTLYEILNTNCAFEPMSDDEFRHIFLTLTTDYMEDRDKNISLAEYNRALFFSLDSFLINEVKDHVMAVKTPKNEEQP